MCESSPTFQGLTLSLSSGCVAEGLEEPKQTILGLPSHQEDPQVGGRNQSLKQRITFTP